MTKLLYLDDLNVGDRFRTASHALDAEQVRRFATAFDPQPFHLDAIAAKGSIFGGLAASGWHTSAITMRLLVTSGPPLANGMVGASVKVDWKAPTRPDDVLRVESEITEITPSRSKPDRGMVVLRSDTLNQRDQIVQTTTATLMVVRRPTDALEAGAIADGTVS